MSRRFSYAEAAALLPEVQRITADIIDVRADLAELGDALNDGIESPFGGVAEVKALEAPYRAKFVTGF